MLNAIDGMRNKATCMTEHETTKILKKKKKKKKNERGMGK